jgi:hypothetical protein
VKECYPVKLSPASEIDGQSSVPMSRISIDFHFTPQSAVIILMYRQVRSVIGTEKWLTIRFMANPLRDGHPDFT